MNLKEFTLISPVLESAEVLTALQTAISPEAIDQAIGHTNSQAERNRALPTPLVICLVIAMSLWAKDSMRSVLKNLVDGVSTAWVRVGQYWRVPCKSAITEARQRVGPRVMSQLFHQVVHPLATLATPGAFIGGLRVVVVDGTVLDVPDSVANARVFGYPGTRPGSRAAFPKIRLVLLIEAGTHLIFDAVRCPYRIGERVRAQKLLRSVGTGMLLMWDRGLHSVCIGADDTGKGE